MCCDNKGWVLTALLILTGTVMAILCHPLNNEAFPTGMLAFEFAKTADVSAAIMASWDGMARDYALLSIGFDYLFMIVYTAWLSWAVLAIGNKFYDVIGWAGDFIGRIVWLALPFDAIETYGLGRQLLSGADEWFACLSFEMAALKFVVIGLACAYILIAGCLSLIKR